MYAACAVLELWPISSETQHNAKQLGKSSWLSEFCSVPMQLLTIAVNACHKTLVQPDLG